LVSLIGHGVVIALIALIIPAVRLGARVGGRERGLPPGEEDVLFAHLAPPGLQLADHRVASGCVVTDRAQRDPGSHQNGCM
jgi:hypothetical protein